MPLVKRASRLDSVSEYWFSRKLKEVAALRAKGADVISLGVGSPDLPPHKTVTERLVDTARAADAHGYQPYTGTPTLRKSVASFYGRVYGVSLQESNVLPLMGSKEGILHVTLAFCNPGDAVLVPNPGYATYAGVSRMVGVEPVAYSLTEAGGWVPDLDELAKADLGRVRILWVNYPHMPTGTPAQTGLFERLVRWCSERSILLVNDNPYSLVLHSRAPESVLGAPGAFGCALELNSLSKSHNMPGWRVGYVVGAAEYIASVLQVKSNFDSGMFRGLQDAASVALTQVPDSWHEERNSEYARRRDYCGQIMDTLGCTYSKEQVGMFLWGRVPDSWGTVEDRLDNLLYGCGVFAVPGSVFGTNGRRYLRLSLCCPVPRLEEALRRVRQHVESGRFSDTAAKL